MGEEGQGGQLPNSGEGAAPSSGGPRRGKGGGGRRFQGKPKVCLFCVEKNTRIDYKQVDLMRRFVNDSGKIRPRRQTGTCARHQRDLAVALKRARHLALIPYVRGQSR